MLRTTKTLSLLLVSILTILVISVFLTKIPSEFLIREKSGFSTTGGFSIEGTYAVRKREVSPIKKANKDIILWGSWLGADSNTPIQI
jgi:hypothetical protein